uniref:Putative transcription termination factor 1 ovary overexpressed n=1 Tax=Rhipicephalus microplus TaxID=6941 RepID=A0A6M2CVT6_RHIMP
MSERNSAERNRVTKEKRWRHAQSPLRTVVSTSVTEVTAIEEADGVGRKDMKRKYWELFTWDSDEHSGGKKKYKHGKRREDSVGKYSASGEEEMFADKRPATLNRHSVTSSQLVEVGQEDRKSKKVKKRVHIDSSEVVDVSCLEETEEEVEVHGKNKKDDDWTPEYCVKGHKKRHEARQDSHWAESEDLLLCSDKTLKDDTALPNDKGNHTALENSNEAMMSEAGDSQTVKSSTKKKCRSTDKYDQAVISPDHQVKHVKTSTPNYTDDIVLSNNTDQSGHMASQHADNSSHEGVRPVKAPKLSSQKKRRKLTNVEENDESLFNDNIPDNDAISPETLEERASTVPEDHDDEERADDSTSKKKAKLHSLQKLGNGKILSKAGAGNLSPAAEMSESTFADESDALFSSEDGGRGRCSGDTSHDLTPEQAWHLTFSSSLSPSTSSLQKGASVSKSSSLLKPCKQRKEAAAFNYPRTELLDTTPSETAFRKDEENFSSPVDSEFLDYLRGKHGFPSIHEKTKPSAETIRCYEEETGLTIDNGKYTAKEDRILLRNIYGIAEYYNIRYPYMIVGHSGDHDPALQKQVKDLVKKKKLLRILGRGLPRRTIHSAYMRARILLNPLGSPSKAVLTPEQKKQVLRMYDTVGPRWTEMAQKMGLGAEQLRSAFRFFKEKETFATGKWEESEDDLLKEAVECQTGDGKKKLKDINWQAVADHVRSRSAVQCRRRWTLKQLKCQPKKGQRKWNKFDSIHLISIMHGLNARRSSEVDWEAVGESFPWAPSPLVAKYHWEGTLNFYLPAEQRKDFHSKVKNLYKIVLPHLLTKYRKGKTLEEVIALSKAQERTEKSPRQLIAPHLPL